MAKLKIEIDLSKIDGNITDKTEEISKTLEETMLQIRSGKFDFLFGAMSGAFVVDLLASGKKIGKMKVS